MFSSYILGSNVIFWYVVRMMVEEEQISFKSDSLMVDGIEDYSHQIAEIICLRNESNFNEAGVVVLILLFF
jgi:hypothetical protein